MKRYPRPIRTGASASTSSWPAPRSASVALPSQTSEPAVHELVRAVSRDRAISEVWEGAATLQLYGARHEEVDALAPIRIGRG